MISPSSFLLFLTVLCLCALPGSDASAQTKLWRDAQEFEVEGRGWTDTQSLYDRLPTRAQGKVTPDVWGLSKDSAGIAVRFQTGAPSLSVRWELLNSNLAMPHMPATGVSGIDLYRRDTQGSWQFVQNGRPTEFPQNTATFSLGGAKGKEAEYLLYLPLYNGVKKVELAVPNGATLQKPPARPEAKQRSIVYYGTSITQGGCASRPGMAHVAILGRNLDRPMINLGFSGSARIEPAISDLLAELDPALYVIDALWNIGNMTDEEFVSRLTTLIQTIRRARPKTPILFVGRSRVHPEKTPPHIEQLQEKVVKRMRGEGVPNLTLFNGATLLNRDGEGTVDGVHPNDLGMMQHAKALTPILKKLLPN